MRHRFFAWMFVLFLLQSDECFSQQDLNRLFEAGKSAIEFNDYPTSIKYLSRLLEIRPNYQEARYLRGKSKYFLRDYDGCIVDMESLLSMNPRHKDAYELMGQSFIQLSDFTSAANAFKSSVEIDESNFETWYNLTYSLLRCHKYSESNITSDYMCKHWQENANVHIMKSRSYFGVHNYKLSERHVDMALAIEPFNLEALTIKGNFLMSSSKWTEAIAMYSRALHVHPKNSELLIRRGLCYSKLQKYTNSLADFQIASDIDPSNKLVVYCLSHYNHPQAVTSILEDLISSQHFIMTEDAPFISLNIETIRDNYDLIPPKYFTDFQKEAYNPDTSFDNGYHHLLLREYLQAIVEYTNFLSISPEIPDGYFHRAYAYAKLGRYEEAILDLNEVISLRPNYAEAYYNRGILYATLLEQEKSRLDLGKAGELGIEFSYEVIKRLYR